MVFVIVGMGLVFMGLERVFPDRDLPPVPGWWVRCIGFNVLQALVVLGGGALWDHGFRTLSVFDLQHLPVLGQGAVGYLIATFVFYVWHRARHEVRPLWRLFHQMHHSPTRLETLTSFYKHPLEIVANALISTALVYGLLGLSVEGAACAAAMSAFAEFFYHVNIKTPRWLGWFIQRPEMHRLHHRRGHHDKNYSDLPIWDMLFGTYENPADVETPCGFDQEKERLLGHLLLARAVGALDDGCSGHPGPGA
ncbi:MAG: sterol desaturase family protein, partial [Myxococcota bacterium]